jgi:hypothetical protein
MHARKTQLLICAAIIAAAAFLPEHMNSRALTSKSAQPRHQAGYIAHIDPLTGEFTSKPASTIETKSDEWLQNALRTSSQGLSEEPCRVPGGGVMVDLRGRFQNVFVATLDDSSGLNTTCFSGDHHLRGDGGGSQ